MDHQHHGRFHRYPGILLPVYRPAILDGPMDTCQVQILSKLPTFQRFFLPWEIDPHRRVVSRFNMGVASWKGSLSGKSKTKVSSSSKSVSVPRQLTTYNSVLGPRVLRLRVAETRVLHPNRHQLECLSRHGLHTSGCRCYTRPARIQIVYRWIFKGGWSHAPGE